MIRGGEASNTLKLCPHVTKTLQGLGQLIQDVGELDLPRLVGGYDELGKLGSLQKR